MISLKFWRGDRSPGPPHVYGEPVDSILATTGVVDRSQAQPTTTFAEFATTAKWHEDGPEFLLPDEEVTAVTRMLDPLRAAWLRGAPPSRRRSGSASNQPDAQDWRSFPFQGARRIQVTNGPHRYIGSPRDVRDLRAVIRLLQKMGT